MLNNRLRPSCFVAVVALGCLAGVARAAPPLPEVACAEAVRLYQAKRYEAAVTLLRGVVARDPAHLSARHYLGLALVRLGQIEEGRRILAAAAQDDPENARLLQDLGLAYLAEGNKAWAVRYLRAARELAPADELVSYHLGVAMLRMGVPDAAAAELERSRFSDRVDQRLVRLQLGLAYYQDQQWERTRQLVEPVLVGEDGAMARRLLRAAYEAEGVEASWVSAQLAAGGVVDTNPFYMHEAVDSTGHTAAPPVAAGPQLSGSVTLRPWVDARNLFWGEISGARIFHFAASTEAADAIPVGDTSPSELGATAFYARRFPLGADAAQLSVGYAFGLILLDGNERYPNGDPALADPNHIFLETHGGHLALRLKSAAGSLSTIRYSLIREDYADLPRSNLGNEVSFEHSRTLLSERVGLLAWASFKHEAAHSADYDAVVPGVGLGVSYLAPLDLVLGLRLGYEHENYLESARGRRWSEQRIDNNVAVTAEVGRALLWDTRLRAAFQYQRNISTLESYDYHRVVGSLNLAWSYR